MNLRMLEMKDAPLMLEWMHDDFVIHDMKADFAVKTLKDCESFINSAQNTSENLHLAIVNDKDIYMGTVSLKHITKASAEFGIVVRRCAMGHGYSKYAMKNIIDRGFSQYGLKKVYWCVSPMNHRAVKYYDKNGYKRVDFPKEAKSFYTIDEFKQFIWYQVMN